MPEVKGARRRSAQTRARIVAAARGLFVARGYTGTTFQDVADAAGVSVQTVYFQYGNKSALLKHVVDVASAGDDEPVPLLDRPFFAALREAPDARAAVQGWTRVSGEILARVAPVLAVVRDAAAGDADMAAQWAANTEQRHTAHGAFVAILAARHALRRGLSRRRATEITVGLLSPDLFLVMTGECGWPVTAWQRWAADQLGHALLAEPDVR
ncbi:TetR family transcriptional regulator [Sphaerisporangium rufum]|uniref:TetR family transcriptional regulator n=1 Tax=Sphaerisporangium rufum TaxID=1381558 RepID=A0A919R805_9ACTN|nr:helix-turn-helix domain-containing protein [Sphaerisporangium rufum]GII80101.1 TetR family transcriptional regulator [Sphaerisporangium rufum]